VLDFCPQRLEFVHAEVGDLDGGQHGDSLQARPHVAGIRGRSHARYALNGTPTTFTLRLVGQETEATSTVLARAVMGCTRSVIPAMPSWCRPTAGRWSGQTEECAIKREAAYAGAAWARRRWCL